MSNWSWGVQFLLGFWLLLVIFLTQTSGIKWLGVSKAKFHWNDTKHCPQKEDKKKYGLTGAQVKLCKRNAPLMPAVIIGAKVTKVVCQQQFADRRWNCSSLEAVPNLSNDLTRGTREQAYVYALSAGSITHAVAKGCASGLVFYCPCGQLPNEVPSSDFKWQGCSDNVHYGTAVSQNFIDSTFIRNKKLGQTGRKAADKLVRGVKKLNPRQRVNQHNSEVGRKVVQNSLQIKCKCHGVSSSCAVKTCWKALPPIEEIGAKLKEKYLHAFEVRPIKTHTGVTPFEPVARVGKITEEDLIYMNKSPDYCTEDVKQGSMGTVGRLCNATQHNSAGCDSMCCGRGYYSVYNEVVESCHCKYVHCCYVKCKECRYIQEKHYCK